MVFISEMRDILEKEKKKKPVATSYNADWYIEDLLLAYKYGYADRYFNALEAIKKFLPGIVYHIFQDIGEKHFEGKVIL